MLQRYLKHLQSGIFDEQNEYEKKKKKKITYKLFAKKQKLTGACILFSLTVIVTN